MTLQTALGVLLALLLLAHVAVLVLLPIGWFGDDLHYLKFAAEHREASVRDVFTWEDRALRRYRPLEKLLCREVWKRFDLDTRPLRAVTGASLVLTIGLGLALARRAGVDAVAARLGLIGFLVHQALPAVLYRNARMEQHVALCGLLALLAWERWLREAKGWSTSAAWGVGGMGVSLLGALLWSEAAAGLLLVVIAWSWLRGGSSLGRWAAALVALAVGTGFVVGCLAVGAPLSDTGRYAVSLGGTTVRNAGIALAGWLSPVSSILVVRWLRAENWAALALAALIVALIVAALIAAGRRVRRLAPPVFGVAGAFYAAAVLALFPVVLLQHLSEAYLYPSLLFFCMASGVLVGHAARLRGPAEGAVVASRGGRSVRLAVVALLVVAMGGHLHAMVTKVAHLRHNATRFARLTGEIESGTAARRQGTVHLVDRSGDALPISQYVLPMRLVYLWGPQRGWDVVWLNENQAPPRGFERWAVRPEGRLSPLD